MEYSNAEHCIVGTIYGDLTVCAWQCSQNEFDLLKRLHSVELIDLRATNIDLLTFRWVVCNIHNI